MNASQAEKYSRAIRNHRALQASILIIAMMAVFLGAILECEHAKLHGACAEGNAGLRCSATAAHRCACAEMPVPNSGTPHTAGGVPFPLPAFVALEWEGLPPEPIQVAPITFFVELPLFPVIHSYCDSSFEPLDPPPRLNAAC